MIEDVVGGIVDGVSGFLQNVVAGAIAGIAALADQVVQLLPAATDLNLPDLSGWLTGYALMNTFLPLSEALTLTGTLVAIYSALMLWRLAVKIYHLIPKPLMGT